MLETKDVLEDAGETFSLSLFLSLSLLHTHTQTHTHKHTHTHTHTHTHVHTYPSLSLAHARGVSARSVEEAPLDIFSLLLAPKIITRGDHAAVIK